LGGTTKGRDGRIFWLLHIWSPLKFQLTKTSQIVSFVLVSCFSLFFFTSQRFDTPAPDTRRLLFLLSSFSLCQLCYVVSHFLLLCYVLVLLLIMFGCCLSSPGRQRSMHLFFLWYWNWEPPYLLVYRLGFEYLLCTVCILWVWTSERGIGREVKSWKIMILGLFMVIYMSCKHFFYADKILG
jgi:hypothetical protein